MQNTTDPQGEFAIVHIRPGTDSHRNHPVGTVAVSLTSAVNGYLVVGYSVQHSKLDSWDAARGREIAVGRAARGRQSCLTLELPLDVIGTLRRRDLITLALRELVRSVTASNGATRRFRLAMVDTLARVESSSHTGATSEEAA